MAADDTRDVGHRDPGRLAVPVGVQRRRLLKGVAWATAAAVAGIAGWPRSGLAQEVTCPPAATPVAVGTPIPPTGETVGVVVAYLSVPYYANFKTGVNDGAAQFGLAVDLRDGQGDLAVEVASVQDFVAEGLDLIVMSPSGEGIIPAIKQANEANIPVVEVDNRAGFGSDEVDVVTYVGGDDTLFGRLQAELFHSLFAGEPARYAYVMGFAGSSPQILRAEGWDEVMAGFPQYEEVARQIDDFDSAKALSITQDLLSRFPEGELDAIVMQGPEGVAAAEFARQNGRDEVKFILGDYPADVRQAIIDGHIVGTIKADPYELGFESMRVARMILDGRVSEVPTPLYVPVSTITADNAEATAPVWGCP
jgi:ABC-type sugar transport system substrate-binding protein